MVDDARYRSKVYLDTYLLNANLTKDDNTTQVTFITAYGDPDYPFYEVMYSNKDVDLVFSIFTPSSTGIPDWDGTIIGYNESVPIHVYTVKKQRIDGNKLQWKAEAELRRVVETHPIILGTTGYRSIRQTRDNKRDMGGWTLHSTEYLFTYERDTT